MRNLRNTFSWWMLYIFMCVYVCNFARLHVFERLFSLGVRSAREKKYMINEISHIFPSIEISVFVMYDFSPRFFPL